MAVALPNDAAANIATWLKADAGLAILGFLTLALRLWLLFLPLLLDSGTAF